MSDPYNNQYNQYPHQSQYGSPAPGQGYPPPQQGYGQQSYDPYNQQQQQQQQHHQQYQQPPQGQGYYGQQQDPYQQQQQGGGYGPPAQGGFQHGQQSPAPYGGDPYQQQNQGAYGQQYPGAAPANQFPQQGAYDRDQYPQNQQPPNAYGAPGQNYGPTDPGAQQEGDRGLMGALGGGAAGYWGGKKLVNHGVLGAIAGAIAGSKLEDSQKKPKHSGYH